MYNIVDMISFSIGKDIEQTRSSSFRERVCTVVASLTLCNGLFLLSKMPDMMRTMPSYVLGQPTHLLK